MYQQNGITEKWCSHQYEELQKECVQLMNDLKNESGNQTKKQRQLHVLQKLCNAILQYRSLLKVLDE